MSQKKQNLAAVSTFADHEVIVPPNKLKKAVEKVKPGTKIDFDPVARAEAALAELADDFSVWMEQECLRLDAARNAIKASGVTPGNRDVLFRAAHDIKGQAATFGFPMVAPVADSLCRLIEYSPELKKIPLAIIDQHVDAIRAIVREHNRGDIAKIAGALVETLRSVTDEFLVAENQQRPEVLRVLSER